MKRNILIELKNLDKQIVKKINKIYKEEGINLTHNKAMILLYLSKNKDNEVNSKMLEKIFPLSKSSLSEMLTSLTKDGLIIKKISKLDNRKSIIKVSDKALSLSNKVEKELSNLEKDLLKDIDNEKLNSFFYVLDIINSKIDKERE